MVAEKSSKSKASTLLGAHLSIQGGTPNAVNAACQLKATALQIFVKNNHRWEGKPLLDEEVAEFRRRRGESRIQAALAHTSYLINLASPDRALRRKSIQALAEELCRCQRLALSHLVMHPGAHVGSGEAKSILRIARAVEQAFQLAPDVTVRVALETTAGQGTSLGYRFAHFRDILSACPCPERLSICLDTCHVFAAGYDFSSRSGYLRMMRQFDRVIGLEKLQVLHLNDSKRGLGSRVDRHEHIGKGEIGLKGFSFFMNDPALAGVPKILETPKEGSSEADRKNLETLRALMS